MLLNTASQIIGAQMVSATDGSAFTGTVTVYVTGNGGTQAIGSVGSGVCTHEGNGFHTYAPAQAETNYAHIGFTFIGTGAVPATVQVYTRAGDAFTRLGAPVNASISADIAAVKTETASLQSDTNDIQNRLPAALVSGRMDSNTGAMAANVLTATAINADAFTAAKFASDVTAEFQSGLATSAALSTMQGNVTDILADTAVIGAAGAGLTAVPWNAAWDTEVQSEVADALAVYDPPTSAEMDARTLVAANYATAANLATVDTAVDAILVTTNKLDNTLENTSDGYIFTVNGLQNAPSGSGPTAAAIADAVWEEAIADHSGTAGSTAEALNAAGSAGDPWVTSLPGAYGSGSAGFILGTNLNATVSSRAAASVLGAAVGASISADIAAVKAETASILTDTAEIGAAGSGLTALASAANLATVDGIVDAILVDTAEIGAAGAGLTAVPWNASWDAEVQSEVADALAVYDPPTNAEMVARTLATADYATAAALATVDTVVDTIQVTTDKLDDMVVTSSDGWIYTAAALQDAPVDGSAPSASAIADAVWDEAVDGATTARQSVRLANSALGGKASGLATTEATFRDLADTKDRLVATVDADGNRSAVTRDLT